MRCQKSRRECPGYRDSLEINFYGSKWMPPGNRTSFDRNSTLVQDIKHGYSNTAHYASAKSMRELPISPVSSRSTSSRPPHLFNEISPRTLRPALMDDETLSPSSIPWSLTTPLEQQASCFFLSNFVLLPTSSTERGYLDFLIPLLKSTAPRGPIALAFSATSLAAFGNRPSSKSVSPLSGQYYLRALNKITAAIQDPAQATEDSVLGSVILLSFFEVCEKILVERYHHVC